MKRFLLVTDEDETLVFEFVELDEIADQ